MKNLLKRLGVVLAVLALGAGIAIAGGPAAQDVHWRNNWYFDGSSFFTFSNLKTAGTATLTSASPSTATVTVNSGARCICTNQTTQANPVKCAVSSTTLTITGPNTVTDVVTYFCFN